MDVVGEGNLPTGAVEQTEPSNLNISDVLEAISIADPSFGPGIDEEAMYRPEPAAEARPYVRILEQPAGKALRFRYECEGRSAGSIPGASSTPEKKTFPSIEIVGHKGRAIVVVSCVTKDEPYRSHPHNLVGRDLCKKGVCTVNVAPDSPIVTFSNLGIQCVKRRDIEEALRLREEMRVDPFKKGFAHKNQPQSIDLNAVRLCFQVFLPDEKTTKIRHALPPVVSDVIYDKKAMSDLVITRLSHCSGPVAGGKQVILLCEKVAREDIAVTFFERVGDRVTWQADAQDLYVHKQVAICFTTPPYKDLGVTDRVRAFIQLRRPTDNATSDVLPFELTPQSADANYYKRKRQKPLSDLSHLMQPADREMNPAIPNEFYEIMALQRDKIKLEPRERTSPHHVQSPPLQYRSPHHYPEEQPEQQHFQWAGVQVDTMQQGGGLAVGGASTSHAPQYSPQLQDLSWQHMPPSNITQMSPNNVMSPSHMAPAVSPNHLTQDMAMAQAMNMAMSPNHMAMSPNHMAMSPNHMAMSPNHMAMSPNHMAQQTMSPQHNMAQAVSPNHMLSPIHQMPMSPNMGHVSPNLVQQQNMAQQQLPQGLMETGATNESLTGLLAGADHVMLNSAELSGLSGLLAEAERGPDGLSDSLNRLSTGDLLKQL